MELSLEPEIYSPSVDENGNYIDSCPNSIQFGVSCPCGAKSNWIYNSKSKFKSHCSSITHKKWLKQLNTDKQNYYKDNIKLQNTIKAQQQIIQQLENKLLQKQTIITYLENKNNIDTNINLLDIDS